MLDCPILTKNVWDQNLRSKRTRPSTSSDDSTDFELIVGMLPSSNSTDDEDEDEIRELYRSILKLFWVQALDHLNGIEREEEMLRSAPPRSDKKQASDPSRQPPDDSWRLDMPTDKRRLIDDKGRASTGFSYEYREILTIDDH